MKKLLLLTLCVLCYQVSHAQEINEDDGASDIYDIAFKGQAVTLDGNLDDWSDAEWRMMSQIRPDSVHGNDAVVSANNFSGFYAFKMDENNLYVAARVHDEGQPMYGTEMLANFDADAIAVYAGLYDIGNKKGSPHVEMLNEDGNHFIHPTIADSTIEEGRTYRISPDADNLSSTLGPDYQMVLRALPYQGSIPANTDGMRYAYNYGIIDWNMDETTAYGKLDSTSTGYYLEWKIPFSSLAGKIANPDKKFADFEWPLFEPEHGMVIPMDVDFTDRDSDDGDAIYFSEGDGSRWRDSFSYELRARIVDLSQHPYEIPNQKVYVDHKTTQNVTIDGNLGDWMDAQWKGMSQDHPSYGDVNASPDNFHGYYAVKMDDDNIYYAVRVKDEGQPMYGTEMLANFDADAFAAYAGLYDISDRENSPHTEMMNADGNHFIHPTIADSTFQEGRTYRIKPDADNVESTRGADYQMVLRALPYQPGNPPANTDGMRYAYNYGIVDWNMDETMVAGKLDSNSTGYMLEWKIPFSSLSGKIANPDKKFADFEWPLYTPKAGDVLPMDFDLTDRDSDEGDAVYMSEGTGSRWRDSFAFKMRGQVVNNGDLITSIVDEDYNAEMIPENIHLKQNYPNPFNPATIIEFSLPEAASVTLTIYNMLGQQVATLVEGKRGAGVHTVRFDASNLSSGVYLYRLVTPSGAEIQKMTLIK